MMHPSIMFAVQIGWQNHPEFQDFCISRFVEKIDKLQKDYNETTSFANRSAMVKWFNRVIIHIPEGGMKPKEGQIVDLDIEMTFITDKDFIKTEASEIGDEFICAMAATFSVNPFAQYSTDKIYIFNNRIPLSVRQSLSGKIENGTKPKLSEIITFKYGQVEFPDMEITEVDMMAQMTGFKLNGEWIPWSQMRARIINHFGLQKYFSRKIANDQGN